MMYKLGRSILGAGLGYVLARVGKISFDIEENWISDATILIIVGGLIAAGSD